MNKFEEPEPHETKMTYSDAFRLHHKSCLFHARRIKGTKWGKRFLPASLATKTSTFATLDLLVKLGLIELDDVARSRIEEDLCQGQSQKLNNCRATLLAPGHVKSISKTLKQAGLDPDINRSQKTVTVCCQEVLSEGSWTKIIFDDHGNKVSLRFHHSDVPSVTTRGR